MNFIFTNMINPFIVLFIFYFGFSVGWKAHKRGHRHRRPVADAILFLNEDGEEVSDMNLKDNNQLPISISPADEFGNPTQSAFDAAPTWSVDDVSIATVSPAADGLSAVVTPTGKLGSCNVQALGLVGGNQIQGTLELDIIAGDVAEVTLTPGSPVAFVPATPAPTAPPAS